MYIHQLNLSFNDKEIRIMCDMYNHHFQPNPLFTSETYENIDVIALQIALSQCQAFLTLMSLMSDKANISIIVDELIEKLNFATNSILDT